jgi:acyl-coenzyme A thioesterase PaaI-like protein
MPESRRSRLLRLRFNTFPAYRRTGARVTYVADDFREVRVRLPLNVWTRNVYGTTFGGSMYAAVDPIYAIMLLRILGRGYEAWDKAVAIRFLRPGRSALHARFALAEAELEAIRRGLETSRSVDRTYPVALVDGAGEPCAEFEKTVTVRRRA